MIILTESTANVSSSPIRGTVKVNYSLKDCKPKSKIPLGNATWNILAMPRTEQTETKSV